MINRSFSCYALAALLLLTTVAIAEPPVKPSNPQSDTKLNTVTIEAQRQTLERQVDAFVSPIARKRFDDSLARSERPTALCPVPGA